jgi:hypothetical protein
MNIIENEPGSRETVDRFHNAISESALSPASDDHYIRYNRLTLAEWKTRMSGEDLINKGTSLMNKILNIAGTDEHDLLSAVLQKYIYDDEYTMEVDMVIYNWHYKATTPSKSKRQNASGHHKLSYGYKRLRSELLRFQINSGRPLSILPPHAVEWKYRDKIFTSNDIQGAVDLF